MTAPYLQPGDRIHLAIPVSNRSQADAQASLDDALAALIPQYAALGVTIAIHSGTSSLDRPTVVAVFRNPNPKGAAS